MGIIKKIILIITRLYNGIDRSENSLIKL